MKIAIVLFELNSEFGGILNWITHLAHGFIEAGHEPTVFYARMNHSDSFRIRDVGGKSSVIDSGFGLQIRVHASGGRGKLIGDDKITRSAIGKGAEALCEELSDYDGVIIAWPPSYADSGLRNKTSWMEALKHGKPQVVIAHDCHWMRIYPWILGVKDYVDCLIGVHPAAYESIKNWPGKICNIFNAFDISDAYESYEKDPLAICNTAFWKKWKFNDDAVRTAAFIKPYHYFFTGGGIEMTNMNADFQDEDHIRKYARYYWKEDDKDVKEDWVGKRVWEVAEERGFFHYLGLISNRSVKLVQRKCVGLTEFAKHPTWGEHWNRALIEGMIHRCVPFARATGALGNLVTEENVVLLPEEASPKRAAEIIKDALADHSRVKSIVKRNLELLPIFDRKFLAKQYIRLFEGRDPQCYQGPETGQPDKKVRQFMYQFCIRRFPRLPAA